MFLYALKMKLTGASPEVKLFFLRLLLTQKIDQPLEAGIKQLAGVLDIRERVVSKGLIYLSQHGYLNREYLVQGKGRPTCRYYFQPKLTRALERLEVGNGSFILEALIKDLLLNDIFVKTEDAPNKAESRRHRLNASNRLFLSVLLAYADKCGVVKDLSRGDLSKLTGMSLDRIDSQVDKLVREKYVRGYVPGGTGSILFDKAKGIYFLNISHPAFGHCQGRGPTFLYLTKIATDPNECSEADAMYVAFRSKGNQKGGNSEVGLHLRQYTEIPSRHLTINTDSLMRFFPKEDMHLKVYFQTKLELYAAEFLNHHWEPLEKWEDLLMHKDFDYEAFARRVRAELIPERIFKGIPEDDKLILNESIIMFCKLVYEVSSGIAKSIQRLLLKHAQLPFQEMEYVILPINEQKPMRRSFGLLTFYKSGLGCENSCYLITEKLNKENKNRVDYDLKVIEDESQLVDEEKYFLGLLTRPQPVRNSPKNKEIS